MLFMTKEETLRRLDALRATVAALPEDVRIISAEVTNFSRTGHNGRIHLCQGDGGNSCLDASAKALGVAVDRDTERESDETLWRFASTPDRIELFEIVDRPAGGEGQA